MAAATERNRYNNRKNRNSISLTKNYLKRACRPIHIKVYSGGLKMQDLKMKDHKNRTGKWRTSVISG